MNRRTPDDLPPELLAAYADGELGPHARDRVERWLADHPEAREIVDRILRETTTPVTVPDDLRQQVETLLRERPALRWDDAVRIIADGDLDEVA